MTTESRAIAVLIDGDNAQAPLIEHILAETAKYGTVTTRRIYGDRTSQTMSSWKDSLNSYAIQPVQQFAYTTGKNSTDSALIIDAMDLLHGGTVQGFCIVSSDSDYTRLATRIREQGLFVMGIGREQTPKSLVNACEVFVYVGNLVPQPKGKARTGRDKSPEWTDLVERAMDITNQDEDGWILLANLGSGIRQLDPSFDPRTYGHKQLTQLLESRADKFELRQKRSRGASAVHYARLKA